ncbi:MAG TPA: hypothetical protein VHV54_05305, partial [Candidatus Binatia bacterium]|nr:hypothetical protein [Candidatus Binatia bacterium]
VLDHSRSNPNAGKQFGKRKRLCDVVVSAEIQSSDAIAFLDSSSDKYQIDALQVRVSANALDQFESIHFWHHDIGKSDLHGFRLKFLKRLYTI